MRVLYFAPEPSTGASLPTAAQVERGLNAAGRGKFAVADAFDRFGIEGWDDFLGYAASFGGEFDAVLLCVPPMAAEARAGFFSALKTYSAREGAKPVISMSLQQDPAATAHALLESGKAARRAKDFRLGPFAIDFERMLPVVGGETVTLTQKQQAVFEALAAQPGKTISKEALSAAAYPGEDPNLPMVAMLILQIRDAITRAAAQRGIVPGPLGHRAIRADHARGFHIAPDEAEFNKPVSAHVKAPEIAIGNTVFTQRFDSNRLGVKGTGELLDSFKSRILLAVAARPGEALRIDASPTGSRDADHIRKSLRRAAISLNRRFFADRPEQKLGYAVIGGAGYVWSGEMPAALQDHKRAVRADQAVNASHFRTQRAALGAAVLAPELAQAQGRTDITIGGAAFSYDAARERLYTREHNIPLTSVQRDLFMMAHARPGEAAPVHAAFKVRSGFPAAKSWNEKLSDLPGYPRLNFSFVDGTPYVWLGGDVPANIRLRFEANQAKMKNAIAARRDGKQQSVLPFTEAAQGGATVHPFTPRGPRPQPAADAVPLARVRRALP